MAQWGWNVRIYERSTKQLPDDIRGSILAEMTKGQLKEPLMLNAAKLRNHEVYAKKASYTLITVRNLSLSRRKLTPSKTRARTVARKGIRRETAEVLAEERRKARMATVQEEGAGAPPWQRSMSTETVEWIHGRDVMVDTFNDTRRERSRRKSRARQRVNVLDEQSVPGDKHDKDPGGLFGDLCAVHVDMNCADDGDCGTEVVRGRRTVRSRQQVESCAVHDEWPTELKMCVRVRHPEVLDDLRKSKKHQQSENGPEDRDESIPSSQSSSTTSSREQLEQLDMLKNRDELRDGLSKRWNSLKSVRIRDEHRDGLCKSGNRWKSSRTREGLRKVGELRRRDGMSDGVNKNRQSVDNIEKHRHHLRSVENFEEIEATIDSGAAGCVCPRDLRNDVPSRQCAESQRGTMFRSHQNKRVQH